MENNNENQSGAEIEFDTVTLLLENDEELECAILNIFEVDGQKYIALLPENDNEPFFYRYIETDDEPELGMIEDDDEFEAVADAFDEWLDLQEFEAMEDDE